MKLIKGVMMKKIILLVVLIFGLNSQEQKSCDQLYGCPIDPIHCIKNPSSCGIF